VGDRDRASLLDLFPKQRDDAPTRAEHVAEPHAAENCLCVALTVSLDYPLAHRLRGAERRRRVHGLVGRDENETFGAGVSRRRCAHLGADRVVANGLEGIVLGEGHMLVGGGVEYDVGAEALHHLLHPFLLLAIGQDRLAAGEVALLDQLPLDLEQVVFGMVEHHQKTRVDARDLATEL
jgi:hypothetical protein